MTFAYKQNYFYLDNRKVFLNSGEIHYFRIKRDLWNLHLQAAREAGLLAVSTYVPWAWHEPEEGVFDFNGSTLPERDLEGWLRLCRDQGLYCILKPGPFILAETRGAGLPDWFLGRYGEEVKMRNSKGDIVRSDGVNLFHPAFLEKVALWYDQVMPIIGKNEISANGPVILMQLCNEIGVFSWLAHQADYGRGVKERFISFLEKRFSGIGELNRQWETSYEAFSEILLPPDGRLPFTCVGDRGRDYDWHCFWREYYGDYLKMLDRWARERGVTVPFYHNLPGWIYGHGYEFPVNITMYEELFGNRSNIIFGVDHIPEFLSYRNMHDDRIINDITRAMQGEKPLFAAEFQCGSREYHVVTNPRELELFYKASIAHGLTGWNYYMFSQGKNPRHRGYSGDTFYWFTPLTPEGERTGTYPLIKHMSRMIKTSESIILEAERKAGICVLFYPPYYATELERPEEGASGLVFNYAAIRRTAYFDGLLKALQVLNVDFDMADLSKASAGALGKYRQVWAFCTDEMNAGDQQTLVDYARAGGNLVIFPHLPDREMSQKPCTIIRDAVPVKQTGVEVIDSPLIDLYDLKDIKCANPQVTFDENLAPGAEAIATTIKGSVCGFGTPLGKGSLIHLGTWLGYDTEGHKPAYETILKRSGAKLRQASAGNDYISVSERFAGNGTALLFIGNYYNEEHRGKVTYTHPENGEPVSIPYSGGEMLWPALYGLLVPVGLEIRQGLKVLHCTSDILGISHAGECTEITLSGDRDLGGEIVFEGANAGRIKSAMIGGITPGIRRDRHRTIIEYRHGHNKELSLKIEVE